MTEQKTKAAAEPPLDCRVRLWSNFSAELAGWCVWKQEPGSLTAELIAGPFKDRDDADALLGPELKQIDLPNELSSPAAEQSGGARG